MRKGLERVLGLCERLAGSRLTYHARPARAADVALASEPCPGAPLLAIVLQGPIAHEADFTLETMRLYAKTFPGGLRILSTWRKEKGPALDRFRQEGVEVVTSDPPATPGQQHFNYQLVSARAGIEHAAARGAGHVIKSRTDQRMYATNIHAMLLNLLRAFPLADSGVQRERIVGASLNTFLYRLYGMTDMLTFGHVDDMLLYWGAALTDRSVPKIDGPRT